MHFLMLLSLASAAFAVPALRVRRYVTLTDGSRVLAMPCGDEHGSWMLDGDGFVLDYDAATQRFMRTKRTPEAEIEAASRRRVQAARRVGSQASAPLASVGSPRVPVILVNFTDSTFSCGQTDAEVRQYYDDVCNGIGNGVTKQVHGNYGAVADYFRDQSGGLFNPQFTIIGPVTLNHPESYYGSEGGGGSHDTRYSEFCRDAVYAATQIYDGDWMDFDNKHKGSVDMVFFIFAGCGQNTDSDVPTLLWPKESTASTTINNIIFATSACVSERRAVFSEKVKVAARQDGIGVMCHELSHALGLPDLYDTRKEPKGFGMDLWSLMDYGCYAGNGQCPISYTTYELDFMGWRSLRTIEQSGLYTLLPTYAGGEGLKLINPENSNEYYVLENRQRGGWDTGACKYGNGMQVTHVDYIQDRWNTNSVNTDENHQLMTIIAANNRYIGTTANPDDSNEILTTWKGNMYPFEGNDSLTAHSVPAAKVYTASGFMQQEIFHIRVESDKSITFRLGRNFNVGVEQVEATATATTQRNIYDLSGRRLQDARKPGLYIIDGRKRIIVK